MKALISNHAEFWKNGRMRLRLLLSAIMLVASIGVTYVASSYTDGYAVNVASDLLLDRIPMISVAPLFFQGAALFMLIVAGVLVAMPKFIPFVFESSALFYFMRSLFMVMTHLTPPSVEYYSYGSAAQNLKDTLFTLSSGNDLFFSGHAGFPFLMMLIFWEYRYLRYFFLGCSIVGSVTVLVGHLHYSIDVFSAYFITYGIFVLSKKFFRYERALVT